MGEGELNSYAGVVITVVAYLGWFVVRPILLLLVKLLVMILDFVRRVVVIGVVFAGAAFGGYLLLNGPPPPVLDGLSRDLVVINALVMLVGLGFLAFSITRYYLRTPLIRQGVPVSTGEEDS